MGNTSSRSKSDVSSSNSSLSTVKARKGYWGLTRDLLYGRDQTALFRPYSDLSSYDLFLYQAELYEMWRSLDSMSVESQCQSSAISVPHPLIGVASSSSGISYRTSLHHGEPTPRDELPFGLLATAASWSDLCRTDEQSSTSPIVQWQSKMRPVLYAYRESTCVCTKSRS
jgi:hypothetical protein